MLSIKERRRFVRHPICYPLEFEYAPKKIRERCHTLDISEGGLLFQSKRSLHKGRIIIMKLPLQNKLHKVQARVVHVTKDAENPEMYNVGVAFYRQSDAFEVKLIEQIYLMDEYRSLRSIELGREISFKDASLEWVKRYAKKFDEMFWGSSEKSPRKYII